MQTSFAVVVSGFGLNVKQRTYYIIAVVTRCSDQGCHLKFGAVFKLFKYLNVEALVNIRSL